MQSQQTAMYLKTTVLPGGNLDLTSLKLPYGETVEIFVLLPQSPAMVTLSAAKPSALEILAQAPGHRLFQTAAAVASYLQEERESWER